MSTLEDEIFDRSREIQTDGYPMSIGEVLSLYRDGDIDIHPEFQRIFRWNDDQKSRLIESVLLGIPIPSIFVSQREDGIWDVVDGVQRLSTILEFAGIYVDENGNTLDPLVLKATEYLPKLDGHTYDGAETGIGETLRRDFKRSKLDFRIVKKESDKEAKYDLFQRLNSGTDLSPQESRNCLLVMIDASFFKWLVELSLDRSFHECVALSNRKVDEGFRQELALRFLLQLETIGGTSQLPMDLGDYITSWVRAKAESKEFDRDEARSLFERVFYLVNGAVGDDAFRRWDREKGRFLGAFSISAFEAITSGVAHHIDAWESPQVGSADLRRRIEELWESESFQSNSGTAWSGRRRLPRLVELGRTHFDIDTATR